MNKPSLTPSTEPVIYKICPRDAWRETVARGELPLSEDDARDGFVHLSTAGQLRGSLDKHFAGKTDLVLLCIPVERLPGEALRFEPSRAGEHFPHLYAVLRSELVSEVFELPLDGAGRHQLPEGI
jgi:uncharacterized protein (DUF952 family)